MICSKGCCLVVFSLVVVCCFWVWCLSGKVELVFVLFVFRCCLLCSGFLCGLVVCLLLWMSCRCIGCLVWVVVVFWWCFYFLLWIVGCCCWWWFSGGWVVFSCCWCCFWWWWNMWIIGVVGCFVWVGGGFVWIWWCWEKRL